MNKSGSDTDFEDANDNFADDAAASSSLTAPASKTIRIGTQAEGDWLTTFRSSITNELFPDQASQSQMTLIGDNCSVSESINSWRGNTKLLEMIHGNRGIDVFASDSLSTRASPRPEKQPELDYCDASAADSSVTTLSTISNPVVDVEQVPAFGPPPPLPPECYAASPSTSKDLTPTNKHPPPLPKRPTIKCTAVQIPNNNNSEVSIKKRSQGHKKTKSLDIMHLILGNATSSGTAKSNSLKRGICLNDEDESADELLRIKQAHGVVRQLTKEFEDSSDNNVECVKDAADFEQEDKSSMDNDKRFQKATIDFDQASPRNLEVLGEECSSVSSTTTKSASCRAPIEKGSKKQELLRVRRSNSMETPKVSQHIKTKSLDRHRTLTQMDSIDPISRDMEIKNDTLKKNGTESSLSSSGTSQRLTHSFNRTRNFIRTCRATTSGFLRKFVQKAMAPRGRESLNSSDNLSLDGRNSPSILSTSVIPSSLNATTTQTQMQAICRPKNTKKGPFDFERLKLVQEMNNEHTGSIWIIKFSPCGKALATAGQDHIVRVWLLQKYSNNFENKRRKYTKEQGNVSMDDAFLVSTAYSDEGSTQNMRGSDPQCSNKSCHSSTFISSNVSVSTQSTSSSSISFPQSSPNSKHVFMPKPFCIFRGHTEDIIDLSWSSDFYILSSGMDKTIKLWHLFVGTCLAHFTHPEPVSCVGFLPKDGRYFISGCIDGRIRLWSAYDKKVVVWNEVEQLITAITFVRNGKFVVVGTYNGRCFFYTTDQLKYHTVVDVCSSSGQSSVSHKICSLATYGDKLLIASNDSRVRMYDLRDMCLTCKFKGAQIQRMLVRASFSPDGHHIICGSEDNYIYLWRTGYYPSSSPSCVQKDKNTNWERFRTDTSNSIVTAAVFSPKPQLILSFLEEESRRESHKNTSANNTPREQELKKDADVKKSRYIPSLIFSSYALPSANFSELQRAKKNSDSSCHLYNYANNFLASASDLTLPSGDVIVTADLNGSIKVFANQTHLTTGSSTFFLA